MKIYTSYFANLRNIPPDIFPISIAHKSPNWYDGLKIGILAPTEHIWLKYNFDGNVERYTKEFYEEILCFLSPQKLYQYMNVKSGGKDVVLLCYETPNKFCHRQLVSEWLNRNGYRCEEYIVSEE